MDIESQGLRSGLGSAPSLLLDLYFGGLLILFL